MAIVESGLENLITCQARGWRKCVNLHTFCVGGLGMDVANTPVRCVYIHM